MAKEKKKTTTAQKQLLAEIKKDIEGISPEQLLKRQMVRDGKAEYPEAAAKSFAGPVRTPQIEATEEGDVKFKTNEDAGLFRKQEKARKDIDSYYESRRRENPYSVMNSKELYGELIKLDDDYGSGRITESEYFKKKDTINTWRIQIADENELDGIIGELRREKEDYDRLSDTRSKMDFARKTLGAKWSQIGGYSDMEKGMAGNYGAHIESERKKTKDALAFAENRKKEIAKEKELLAKKKKIDEKYKKIAEEMSAETTTRSELNSYDVMNPLYGDFEESELSLYQGLNRINPEIGTEYYKEMEEFLELRATQRKESEAAEFGEEHPYLAGLKAVGLNIVGGAPAAIDNLTDVVTEGKVNTHDATSRMVRESQALRQGGSQYMQKRHGQAGAWAYNTGLSIVENAIVIGATAGIGGAVGLGTKAISAITSGSMAMSAASNQMISIADRGGNDAQIIIGGVAAGAAEYIFEKYSIEGLFNIRGIKGWKNILKATGLQMLTEGQEETLTEIANIFSDAVIMGGNSESNARARALVMDGMSAEEATKQVFRENLDQILQAGVSGAVSGGIMGGSISVFNNAMYNQRMNTIAGNVLNSPKTLNDILRIGNEIKNGEAKYISELIQEGVTPDAKQVRTLVESVANDSITQDASLPGVVKVIGAIEGRNSDYYTSDEAVDTANAVLKMTNGTATKADYALIERSEGARTIILSAEGTKAWDSLKAEADRRMRSAEYGMRSDATSSTAKAVPLPLEGEGSGVKYKGDEHAVVKDGDVFTKDGRKVTISAKADTVNGIVVNGESKRFQKNDSKGYSVAEKLATSFKKPVKFVKGLYDAEGNMLDGAETDSGIFINTEAKNPIKWAATHEFSHTMKKRAGEAWSAYQKFVINKLKKDGTYYKVFDTKAKAYGTRDASYINEEIACDYIGETFDSVDELADLIRKDRGLAVKVRDFYYKALDKLGLLDEKKKAQAMWAKAYREAMKNSDMEYADGVHESKSGTRVNKNLDSGEKITVDMDEQKRTEILKKASLDVVEAKSDALKLSFEEVEILESRCKSKAEKILKELCEKFGIFKKFYKKDIDLEFNYSKSSLSESSHKQYERNPTYSDFAIMLSMFDSVISNAQPIEVHTDKYTGTKREDTNLKQSYVLISAFKNGEFIVPVEINIKEFKNGQENKMHMTVTLKKIRADILAPATNLHSHQSTPSTLNISIADLIKNVNPSDSDFLRYVPNEMLNEAQIKAKKEALEKDIQKIESLRKSVAGTRVVESTSVVRSTEKSATISDGEIYSQGKRVSFEKGERVGGNVVYNEESREFARKKREGYKVIQTMAKDLGMKVKFVKGLVDGDGNVLDGVITSEGIFINTEAENPTRWAATHEFSHRMKQTGGKTWQRYQDYVISHLKETGKYEERYNLKKGAYAENEIDEEIASDYIGVMFEDVKELSDFIRRNRRDAFGIRNAYYKVLDKFGLLDEKKKAQAMWAKAYREAMKNSDVEYEGGVKFSKTYSFNKQVDDALDNEIPRGYSVYVGKLPKLLEKCGLNPELPMLMHPSHIRDINHEQSEDNIHYHGIPDTLIKQIPEMLKQPAMIYDSISEDNSENSVCVLTTQCDSNGDPILIVITNSEQDEKYLNVEMETKKTYANNHVDTMYGKKGFSYHMDSVIDNDAVLYVSKNGINKLLNRKNLRLNSDGKLHLLARLDNLRFDNIIHQSRNVVNTNSMQNASKNSGKRSVAGTRASETEKAVKKDKATVNSKDMRDGEIYSQGKRVSFEKGERVGGNVVYNEESRKFAKKNREGYKVIQTMAKDLGMKVKFVKGLVDGDGNVLDGVITSEGIFINTEAKNPTRWAATHEFSHRMKQTGGKAWQRYQDYVISHLKETGKYEERYNLKKGAYAESEIDEEIAADYIGVMFEDVKELSNFIRRNRKDAFGIRNAYYTVLDKLGLLDEKKKAQAMWAKAYREAMKNSDAEYEDGTQQSQSGTRVEETPEVMNSGVINQDVLNQYKKDVDDVLSGKYKGDDVLVMGGTPKVYTDIGLSKLPITIDQKHVYSIAKTEAEAKADGRYKKGENYHGLGGDAVKNILSQISKPIAIVAHPEFVTKSKRDSTHKVIAIVELTVDGRNIIAPIEIDAELAYKSSRIDANNIATYFDKKNIRDILKEAIALETQNETGIYFADKKRTEALLKQSGYQLPSRLRTHGSNNIIRSISKNVNRKIDTVLKSKQFTDWFGDWQNTPEQASKVVNVDGTPKVMYHGTTLKNGEFEVFDNSQAKSKPGLGFKTLGEGNYFTSIDLTKNNRYDRVIAMYLNIKNPFIVKNDFRAEVKEKLEIETQGVDYKTIQKQMKNQGYDGVIKYDSNGEVQIAVTFDSTQSKSATDNIGTYDRTNPNFKRSVSGTRVVESTSVSDADTSTSSSLTTRLLEENARLRDNIEDIQNPNLTEEDLNEYIRTGKKLHTRNKKQRMIDAGKNPIIVSNVEFKKFISDVIHGKASGEVRAFKKVGKRLADAIQAKRKNLYVFDRYLEINADDLREAYKRHLKPKEKGDIPLKESDFERIPEYIDNFDGVLSVDTYNDKVDVHLYKEVEDGYIKILTVVSKERNSLQVSKLIGVSKEKFEKKYAKKIEGSTGSPQSLYDSNPSTTARHTADAPSTSSIPDYGKKVNKKSVSGTRLVESTSVNDADTAVNADETAPQKFIKPGVEPRREVKVPESVKKGRKVRHFARTAAEAETLTDETAEGVLENVEEGKFNYTPISDKSVLQKAYASLDTMGIEWVEKKVSGAISTHSLDKETVAMAEVLMQRYSEEGQEEKAQQLIIDFAAEGTRMGQSIQAISMLKKLDKNYEIHYIDKVVENLKEDIMRMNNKKLFRKEYSTEIAVSDELKKALSEAKTEEERERVREEIYTELAKQLPTRWIDRWNAWRYFAMLGNARTHVRNVVGNAFFMPMIGVKNISATIMESILDAAVGGRMDRSKTFVVPKQYRQFAKEDALKVKKELSGGGKHNPSDRIRDKQRMFPKGLEWMRIKVGDALEAEDWLFLKKHYQTALANYLAANRIDLEDIDEETLDRARYRAIKEAQRNTYRDVSGFANALSKMSKKNAPAALLVEGLMPFKKTPINVLKRGIEYSPAGLVKVLTYDVYKVSKGDMTESEYIDRLCCGLTGTGVIMLGMLLKSLGVVVGASGDDKEKEFEELQGVQNYSLLIGNHSYTLDWLAPFSMPFFVGVELERMLEDKEGVGFRDVSSAMGNITEPFFEMSMLQGISGAVSTIKSATSAETFGEVMFNATENYFGQAVPTLFGQISRTVDGVQRRSYDDKNVDIPKSMQYFAQSQGRKIPFVSKTMEPYIDNWGRQKITENIFSRAFQNMLSPGYYSRVKTSNMEKELKRLYDSVGSEDNISIFPSKAVNKFELSDGTEKNLSAKEYTKMQEVQGQTAYSLLGDITESDVYAEFDDMTRGKIVTNAYKLAKATAKQAVADGAWAGEKWMTEAIGLIDGEDYSAVADYVIYYTLKNETSEKEARSFAFEKLDDIPDSIWEGGLSESAMREYEENIAGSGISIEQYVAARDYKGTLKTINKDTPEEITPKDQMIEYIDKLEVSNEDKERLYLSMGYAAKTCPW